MGVLQEIILMIDHAVVVLWDMQLLQELFSTGTQTIHLSIHRSHHGWFDEYDSHLSIEYKHTSGSILIQQDPESLIHNSDLLKLVPCELDITYTPFSDTAILTYEINFLLLEIKLVLIYWMMKFLQSLM